MIELSPDMLRRLQMIELEMLVEVDRICKMNGIRYQIIAGTMLGAARNGGFIPWDDDADVALLRPEYEKFVEACSKDLDTSRFSFQDMDETEGYRWGYGKLRRNNTLFLREHQEHMPYEQGVFIDIFPLDNVPESRLGRTIMNFRCFLIRRQLWSEVGKVADRKAFKRAVYARMARTPLEKVRGKLRRLIDQQKATSSSWVRILMFPTPNNEYGYKRTWYEDQEPTSFEGVTFDGVSDPEAYLTFKFGEWRNLPPLEARKTHPVSDIYLLDDGEYAQVLARIEAARGQGGGAYGQS